MQFGVLVDRVRIGSEEHKRFVNPSLQFIYEKNRVGLRVVCNRCGFLKKIVVSEMMNNDDNDDNDDNK